MKKDNKPVTVDDLKKMNYTKEVVIEETNLVTDCYGNIFNIDEIIEQAEKDLEEKQQANLNLRWTKRQIERLKRIAEKRGQKYQTFIKSVLEQVIEAEEKRMGLS